MRFGFPNHSLIWGISNLSSKLIMASTYFFSFPSRIEVASSLRLTSSKRASLSCFIKSILSNKSDLVGGFLGPRCLGQFFVGHQKRQLPISLHKFSSFEILTRLLNPGRILRLETNPFVSELLIYVYLTVEMWIRHSELVFP